MVISQEILFASGTARFAGIPIGAIWEDLLGRQPIGVHENFFELGGDSVLAMSLLARVAPGLRATRLPAGGIFQAPTIAKLAVTLREQSGPESWSPVVPIQPEGTRLPFFCVHPGGGNVLCYLQVGPVDGPRTSLLRPAGSGRGWHPAAADDGGGDGR